MELTRGDTKALKFRRTSGGQPITVKANKMYFTVKTSYDTKDALFQKTIDDMTFDENYYYHFTIDPEDTDKLEYGKYVYDIEVKEETYTKTITKGVLNITKEVTFENNEV